MGARQRRRKEGGRSAKRASRQHASASVAAYIERKIPYFELLDEAALELLEYNADTVLEETGIEFRDFPQALDLFRSAGAKVEGERVRFPRGMCRTIVQNSAPAEFTQHARNPSRSVIIGGKRTVLAPAYGSPFVRDLDQGRRYATLEDFRNFVKLAYLSPGLHHSGGTVCEPIDIPVNKRHFDMVYSHIKYSDKPFMGSVTHPERAKDTVDMAKLVFGDTFVENNTVIMSLINANSPLAFDATMLGAATIYARNNQATVISPFVLAGAMSRRLGVPFRSGGGLCGSKIAGAQAAYESANTLQAAAMAGVNFMLHTAGWLDMMQRANSTWKSMLEEYEPPPLDPSVDAALIDFIKCRKASFADRDY